MSKKWKTKEEHLEEAADKLLKKSGYTKSGREDNPENQILERRGRRLLEVDKQFVKQLHPSGHACNKRKK